MDVIKQPLHKTEPLLDMLWSQAQQTQKESLLKIALMNCKQVLHSDTVQLYLLNPDFSQLHRAAQYHNGDTVLNDDYVQKVLTNKPCLLSEVISQGSTRQLKDELNDSFLLHFMPDTKATSWYNMSIIPVNGPNHQVQGLVVLANNTFELTAETQEQIQWLLGFMILQWQLIKKPSQPLTVLPYSTTKVAVNNSYGILGQSPAINKVRQLISKVLNAQASVLITGETGTGKELVASALHNYGPRKSKPFIIQNCASLPENLLESELFGYKKGAFTGAHKDYKGLFMAADEGTLFLDEIGDMPLPLQAKLLRVLQEKKVRPLGSTQFKSVNVKILAATHQDLQKKSSTG